MLKKIIIPLFILTFAFSAIGCAKVGETTGKVVKEVKEMPSEFKEGYKDGRESTKDEI